MHLHAVQLSNTSQPSTDWRQGEVFAEAVRDLHGVEGVRDVAAADPGMKAALGLHARESATAGQLGAGRRLETGISDPGVKDQALLPGLLGDDKDAQQPAPAPRGREAKHPAPPQLGNEVPVGSRATKLGIDIGLGEAEITTQ